jgi:hypothetical protein
MRFGNCERPSDASATKSSLSDAIEMTNSVVRVTMALVALCVRW